MDRGLFALGLLISGLGFYGASAASQSQDSQVDRIDHLTVRDGLSQATVRDLHQDRQGFLWVGTSDGLNRYDGYEFVVYRHHADDPCSLPSNEVMTILEDRHGTLWFGTRKHGLVRFDRAEECFFSYRHDPADANSLAGEEIWALLEDAEGFLWIGASSTLSRLDPATGRFDNFGHANEKVQDPVLDGIRSLARDRHGHIWVGTERRLRRFDPTSQTFTDHYPNDPTQGQTDWTAKALLIDRRGDLWVGGIPGLYRYDEASESFLAFRHDPTDPTSLADDHVVDLLEDEDGLLWAATKGGGISYWDPTRGSDAGNITFHHYQNHPSDGRSLSSNSLLSFTEGQEGILWVGSYVGIDKIDRRRGQFRTWRHIAGQDGTLTSNNVWPILEDRDGILWVGTYDQGLDRIDRASGEVIHLAPRRDDPQGLPHGTVSSLYEDQHGVLWVGTREGLSRLERSSLEFTRAWPTEEEESQFLKRLVFTLLEDRAGRFWLGTSGVGLVLFDRATGQATLYGHDPDDPSSLSDVHIYSLVEDRRGILWVGTLSHGLNRFDTETGRAVRLLHEPGDPTSLGGNRGVLAFEDRAGTLWVGSQTGGLSQFLGEQQGFRTWTVADGLPSNAVLGILEGEGGELWLSTNQGLSRFDPRTETFLNFGIADGLQGVSFSPASFFKSASGEMFFGGTQGLNSFFPDEIEIASQAPEVVLTALRLFDQPVALRAQGNTVLTRSIGQTQELVLSHRETVFSLQFAALHFADPAQNRFAYRLEGIDRDWIEVGADERVARYSSLPPGQYTFQVKASNARGVWNEEGVSLRIIQRPPPWKTPWAKTLYTLALTLAVLAFVRWQQRRVEFEKAVNVRLREVDRMKDHFLANTSHELRTPLYGMTGLAESLVDGSGGPLPEKVRNDLGMIVSSGQRLGHLVNDLLDFSKLRHKSLTLTLRSVDLHALVAVILDLSHPLLGNKRLQLENKVPTDFPPVEADEARLQQILHNLVGNAIKFTAEGRVTLSAQRLDEQIVIRVSDTGTGVAEDQKAKIFEVFEQGDTSAETSYGGTGLGLAVTRELVELHGGEIWVDATPGGGATFSFTLPCADPQKVYTPPSAVEYIRREDLPGVAEETSRVITPEPFGAALEASSDAESASILIVDDEPVNRRVLANHLAAAHYELREASSGSEALKMLEQQKPDLVLLDVMMPVMSGLEVCRRIRLEYKPHQLPVVFLTAKSQVSDLVTGLLEGGNDYLVKPIAKEELLARIRTHLDLRRFHVEMEGLVEERMAQIKVLQGLLPICSECHKVRDDEGYWEDLETYVTAHSEASFSHGVCKDCARELYAEYLAENDWASLDT